MEKSVLVVGAGEYQLPLIKRIKELGHAVYCVDKNPNAIGFRYATDYRCIDVLNRKLCLEYAIEMNVDGVATYGSTIALPTVSYIAQKLSLPGLPSKTAELSMNKYEIKKVLSDANLNCVHPFVRFECREQAYAYNYSLPCVIKPCDGSGSKGVTVVRNKNEITGAIDLAFDNARFGQIYVEPFLEGEEYTVEAFVENGNIHIYSVIQTTFLAYSKENISISYGHCTPPNISKEIDSSIRCEVEKAIQALNINMLSVNFDVIVYKEDLKPYIIDCGIRVGQNAIASDIVPLARGVNILDNTIKVILGEPANAKPTEDKCISSRLLICNPGKIIEIKEYDTLFSPGEIEKVIWRKQVGDKQRIYQDKSDSCGWVIASGITPEEAEFKAEVARKKLLACIVVEELTNEEI